MIVVVDLRLGEARRDRLAHRCLGGRGVAGEDREAIGLLEVRCEAPLAFRGLVLVGAHGT